MFSKEKIRGKLLKKRKNIPEALRAIKNKKIMMQLEDLDVFKNAHHILFYYSCNGEVDTTYLIKKYIDTKQLYLPVIKGKSHFQAIPIKRPLDLKKGFEGVPEPTDVEPNSVYDNKIELVITPGVAFDKHGNRIGMGKGYYDRYFEYNNKSKKIALAYEEQMVDSIPKDTYDVPVDTIVTDENIYNV